MQLHACARRRPLTAPVPPLPPPLPQAGAITSGELTHRFLEARPDAWWQQLGRRCIHITWSSRGAISLDGLGLEVRAWLLACLSQQQQQQHTACFCSNVAAAQRADPRTAEPSNRQHTTCNAPSIVCQVVERAADADFILAHGTEALGLPGGGARDASLEQLQALLQQCAAEARAGRALPMVVANPDLVTVDGPNSLITMPGTFAAAYAALGGQLRLMGKPDPVIYQAVHEMHPGLTWLAVGDSLEHDIAGCVRVCNRVHASMRLCFSFVRACVRVLAACMPEKWQQQLIDCLKTQR